LSSDSGTSTGLSDVCWTRTTVGGPNDLEGSVTPRAPFGLPMRWGQAPSSTWPGDVARVRRLHAVEEGTPDLGYRQFPTGKQCQA
jgi:hypothetical protein